MPFKKHFQSTACLFLLLFSFIFNGCTLVSYPSKIVKTKDNGFILLETMSSDGDVNAISKLSPDNNHEWKIDFAESINNRDDGGSYATDPTINAVIETQDDCYIGVGATGYEQSNKSTRTFWSAPLIIKLDSRGRFIWRKNQDATGGYFCAAELSNGDIISAGLRVLDYDTFDFRGLVSKYDTKGNMTWSLDFPELESIRTVISLNDGTALLFGSTLDQGEIYGNPYVAKLLPSGETLWQKTYTISNGIEHINKVICLSDGGFMFAGGIQFGTLENHMYFARLDAAGNLLWKTTVPFEESGSLSFPPAIYDIVQLKSQDFIMTGTVEDGYPLGFISRIDATGKTLWTQKTYFSGKRCLFQHIRINPDSTLTLTGVMEDGDLYNQIRSVRMSQAGEILATD